MNDLIRRSDAIDELMHIIPYRRRCYTGVYVLLLDKRECLTAIQAIPSADRPSATEIMKAYHEGVRKGIAEAYEAYGADRPKEKTISVDALREILSDAKEAHRNNSEAEAVISDVWEDVVDMLKGADDE